MCERGRKKAPFPLPDPSGRRTRSASSCLPQTPDPDPCRLNRGSRAQCASATRGEGGGREEEEGGRRQWHARSCARVRATSGKQPPPRDLGGGCAPSRCTMRSGRARTRHAGKEWSRRRGRGAASPQAAAASWRPIAAAAAQAARVLAPSPLRARSPLSLTRTRGTCARRVGVQAGRRTHPWRRRDEGNEETTGEWSDRESDVEARGLSEFCLLCFSPPRARVQGPAPHAMRAPA